MIDGRQCGPYTLDELHDAGVRPSTYVWCKGMPEWQRADEVADICRFYRQRIFNLMHPSIARPDSPQSGNEAEADVVSDDDPYANVPMSFRSPLRKGGVVPGKDDFPNPADMPVNASRPPTATLFLAILSTLICFPFTGCVAIYYSVKATRAWAEAQRSGSKSSVKLYSDSEREELRRLAHDCSNSAKMWIGITFFLGIIMFAFLGHTFF